MAITIDTHIPQPSATTEVALPVIDWSLFKVDDSSNKNTTNLIRVSTGKTYKNRIKVESKDVANVYNNTDLQSSALKSLNKSGTAAYIQNIETWSKYDSTDPTVTEQLLPCSCSVNFKVPNDPAITTEMVIAFCDRSYAELRQQIVDLRLGVTNPKVN